MSFLRESWRSSRWHQLTASVTLASLILVLTSASFAKESTFLAPASSPAAQRALEELQSALRQQFWATALDLAEDTIREHPRELFQVEPGWFVSAALLRRWCLEHVHDAAPQEYLRLVQSEASRLSATLDTNPADRRATLQVLAEQYPGAQQTNEAELELGNIAWRAGNLDLARRCWSRAAVNSKAASSETESIAGAALLRLGMCDVVEGRAHAAQRFQQRLSAEFPTLSGQLGGESGLLPELLQRAIDNARGNITAAPGLELSHQLHRITVNERQDGLWLAPPASIACSARGILLINDMNGIRALDAQTGQPAWPVPAQEDRGFLYTNSTSFASASPVSTEMPFFGIVDEEDWYGGQDLVADANSRFVGYRRLIAVDLTAEGRLRWISDTSSLEALDDDVSWTTAVWASPPATDPAYVYAVLRSSGDKARAAVATIDRLSGKIARLAELPDELLSPESIVDNELRILDDKILWLHGPWLLCLPVQKEGIHWFRRLSRRDVRGANPSLNRLAVIRGQPCVALEDSITQYDLNSGEILWAQENLSPLSGIVGDQDDLLVASGEHVWGIDLIDGAIRWRAGGDDIARTPHGPALLRHGSILWIHDDELWTLDVRTGRALQRLPAEQIGMRNVRELDVRGNLLRLATLRSLTTIELVDKSMTKANP